VKLNNYLTDLKYLPIFREVRDMFVNTAAPPASTTIQITALAREGALLETEAIALLPAKAARAAARKVTSKSHKSKGQKKPKRK